MAEITSTSKILGEFYTPENVVKSLHCMIEDNIGDFYNNMLVWDSAWGTGNLTAGKQFKNLYCSTIRMADIRKCRGVNPEAKKFQYDFLNDDVEALTSVQNRLVHEYKMPDGIVKAIQNNDNMLFMINPPYAGTGNMGAFDNGSKCEKERNQIQEIMTEYKLGTSIDNLYTQFLFRIAEMKRVYKLTNVYLAVICPPQFLTVNTYKGFRKHFLDEFTFMDGKVFQANNFEGLSDEWGIGMSLWKSGSSSDENRERFVHSAIKYNNNGNEEFITNKTIYNIDFGIRACDWVREVVNNHSIRVDYPVFSSGCKVKGTRGKMVAGLLGAIGSKANNVQHNDKEVVIVSGAYSDGCGIPITEDNFDMAVMYFTARRAFTGAQKNWIIDKDEYIMPDISNTSESVRYAIERLKYDGLVYTICNHACHATSTRDMLMGDWLSDERVDVPNNFFWLTKEQVEKYHKSLGINMADRAMFTEDCDRYAAIKIKEYVDNNKLSDKALEMLNMINHMYEVTLGMREEYQSHSSERDIDYQVKCWDAGIYQIKQIVRDEMPELFDKFCKQIIDFSIYLGKYVYESGMLIK